MGSYLGNALGCALGVFLLLNCGLMPQFTNAINAISLAKVSYPFKETFIKVGGRRAGNSPVDSLCSVCQVAACARSTAAQEREPCPNPSADHPFLRRPSWPTGLWCWPCGRAWQHRCVLVCTGTAAFCLASCCAASGCR